MLKSKNDVAKCAGQDNTGNNVCADRNRCGRFLRPEGDRQIYESYWKAGRDCMKYESVPREYHIEDQPWDEKRIDVIGQNGNSGDHYEAA